jgi:hypothetical protein
VRWEGLSPQEVYVDDVPFTLEEIERLKGITDAEGLKAALLIKQSFEGKIIE